MTDDDLVLSDRELPAVFDVARREGTLVMVHCEGYDAIRFLTERREAEGNTAPFFHAASRPQLVEREAAHRAISHEAIWQGLERGVFQTLSSDHCPFRDDGPAGKLNPRGRTSFRWVPNGIPGVETRLPILFSEGVSKGRIGLQRFVELCSTNHTRVYGLENKGSIAVDFDADIALSDPNRRETIRQDILHHGADYTPWEGFAVVGWPVQTLLRGEVIYEDGRVIGEPGRGRVVDRRAGEGAAGAPA